ncbi:MAG: hypothetical protein ACOYN4_03550 [Bacteroidales bacterium]
MNNIELIKLRNSLPFGALSELSIRTKKSKSMVTQVLKGKKNSNLIIDEAIKLAKEEKIKRETRSVEISNL